MRRKRKSLLPDTPLPVPSDILDQFVGQRPISPEELDAAVRRFTKAIIERAHRSLENRPERGFAQRPSASSMSGGERTDGQPAQHTKFGQSQFNRPIFNSIGQSSIQSANLQSNRPIFNPQCNLQSSVCNRQLLIRPMA
jgi:hypothetical protein